MTCDMQCFSFFIVKIQAIENVLQTYFNQNSKDMKLLLMGILIFEHLAK